jgi:hypothetical protein
MNVYAKPTTCEVTFKAAKVVTGSFSSAEMPPALSQSKVMDLKAMKKLEQELATVWMDTLGVITKVTLVPLRSNGKCYIAKILERSVLRKFATLLRVDIRWMENHLLDDTAGNRSPPWEPEFTATGVAFRRELVELLVILLQVRVIGSRCPVQFFQKLSQAGAVVFEVCRGANSAKEKGVVGDARRHGERIKITQTKKIRIVYVAMVQIIRYSRRY